MEKLVATDEVVRIWKLAEVKLYYDNGEIFYPYDKDAVGYIGVYKISCDNIIHYPAVSSFPSYISLTQKRNYGFKGDFLILYKKLSKKIPQVNYTSNIGETQNV